MKECDLLGQGILNFEVILEEIFAFEHNMPVSLTPCSSGCDKHSSRMTPIPSGCR